MRYLLISSLVLGLSLAVSGLPGRIVGGTDAVEGQYPYQVSLQTLEEQHFCGGSILNERFILTAAHCIAERQAQSISIVAGVTTLSKRGERYQIKRLIPHEKYDDRTVNNDIGLILVTKDIIFNEMIQPIKLSTIDKDYNEYPCVLTGWGIIMIGGEMSKPDVLQQIDLKLISNQKCTKLHDPLPITPTNICTLTRVGEGACHSDSGGPLVADGVQVGVVSWGRPCGLGFPDVYARVSSYNDWIEEHMNE